MLSRFNLVQTWRTGETEDPLDMKKSLQTLHGKVCFYYKQLFLYLNFSYFCPRREQDRLLSVETEKGKMQKSGKKGYITCLDKKEDFLFRYKKYEAYMKHFGGNT